MNKRNPFFILIIFINIINGCSGQSSNSSKESATSKECIKLNDIAFQHMDKYNYAGNEKRQLDTALLFLKRAIQCDANYTIAYLNLASVYDKMNNYNAEMDATNKLLILSKNDPAILIKKGVLFEKMNKVDSAKRLYSLAEKLYKEELTKYPDSLRTMLDFILAKAISEGKDAAVKERNEQIRKHPKDSTDLINKTFFLENFDRKGFLGIDIKNKH